MSTKPQPIPSSHAAADAPQRRPRHVAVIMDGNGRWARQRGLERSAGHREGSRSVRAVVTRSRELNIPFLTLFAFSSQNWRRPIDEVTSLMGLLVEFCQSERQLMVDKEIRLRVIGERSRIPHYARAAIEEVEAATAANTAMQLIIAVSYGSREELVHAMQEIAREVQAGRVQPDDITEETISRHLWTADIPDPDLVIRTSGELRVSNFLLWQIAYAELYVDECLWPDFREPQFEAALDAYDKRERRYGDIAPPCTDDGGA